jgi:hypothetical protein
MTVDVGGCLFDASYLGEKTNVSLEEEIFIDVARSIITNGCC